MGQIVQVAIAFAIGAAILLTGRWAVRLLATPGPEGVDPDEIVEVEEAFRCTVCGMRLTVTHAQGSEVEAPRHCREQMEPLATSD